MTITSSSSRSMIADHKYFTVYFTPDTGLLENVFKATTAEMSNDQFIQMHIDMMAAYVPLNDNLQLSLWDCRLFYHEISPQSQDWIDANPVKFVNESPITKAAAVVSDGVFEQMSIEELVSNTPVKLQYKYFHNIDTAYKWLLS
jgi:hypothetical protein